MHTDGEHVEAFLTLRAPRCRRRRALPRTCTCWAWPDQHPADAIPRAEVSIEERIGRVRPAAVEHAIYGESRDVHSTQRFADVAWQLNVQRILFCRGARANYSRGPRPSSTDVPAHRAGAVSPHRCRDQHNADARHRDVHERDPRATTGTRAPGRTAGGPASRSGTPAQRPRCVAVRHLPADREGRPWTAPRACRG
jgi:hypothetical protein